MSILPFFKGKNTTLIIANDGINRWGFIINSKGVLAGNSFSLQTEFKDILKFGKSQGALSVLILNISEVRELEVKLSSSLDNDERRSAIEYAAASNLGDHSGSQCISYLDGMLHDFRSGILVSHFDLDEIVSLEKQVVEAKMIFLGVTNFKQVFLAEHFSDLAHHNDAFLFLLGNYGFVAIPERTKLSIRNLPFGVPPENEEEKTEWKEKLERRLVSLKGKSVTLYSPNTSDSLCYEIRRLIQAQSVEREGWEQSLSEAMIFALKQEQKLIHFALPPPKPKDPKRPGTILAILMVMTTLVSLLFLIGKNHWTKQILQQEIKANQEVISRVKEQEKKVEDLKKELALEQDLFQMMKKRQRLSQKYIVVVNLLSRYPLEYSRVTAIEEQAGGIFIEGESMWQPDLSNFFNHFSNELTKHKLGLFSDHLAKEKDGKIIFKSHVAEGK